MFETVYQSRCQGVMKVIALIQDRAVVRRILEHLHLWRERRGDERGTAPPAQGPVERYWVCEAVADDGPGWDEERAPQETHFPGDRTEQPAHPYQ